MTSLAEIVVEPQWYSLLKDLGGWAVVVYIVHWLTRKVDSAVKDVGGQIVTVLAAMRSEADNHSQAHESILRDLAETRRVNNAVLDAMSRMASRTEQMAHRTEQWHEQRSLMEARTGEALETLVDLATKAGKQ